VQNGGASSREVAKLKMETIEGKKMGYENLSRTRTRRNSGYAGEAQQRVPSRSRTGNGGYGGDMQQQQPMSRTNSGYGNDMQQVLSRKTLRTSGYGNDMQQVPSRSRTRNSGYEVQEVPDRRSSRRVLEV